MKTRSPIVITCLLFIALMLLGYSIWKVRTPQFTGVTHRPEGFPDTLVAPSYAGDVYYECRTVNERMPPGIYSLRFSVNEAFPGERTRNEIGQTLEAEGWRRLTYCLMTPQYVAHIAWVRSKKKHLHDIDLAEHWSNSMEEVISLVYTYRIMGEEKTPAEPLYVGQIFYSPETWIHKFVVAYRKMHPEEFSPTSDMPAYQPTAE